MSLERLHSDESAVSPVIGIIMVVAVTMILAAVIGNFALGFAGAQEQSPQTSLQ